MIRLIIADDHQIFIDGIKLILTSKKNISIAGEANNGGEVLKILEGREADILLMDISMPGMNGIETTKHIQQQFPKTKVLIFTMYNLKNFLGGLLEAGASGYILKNTSKEELINAIETIHNGRTYFSKDVTSHLSESRQDPKQTINSLLILGLRQSEIRVIKLIVQEYTTVEIASMLSISHYTVETHRKNAIRKLNVKNTVGLVKYAFQNGLVD